IEPPVPAGCGVDVLHLRWDRDPMATLQHADALFIGGGNTYALLKRLREAGLLEPIGAHVRAGLPYLGSSAGANVAGPTILTTNDWNVVGLDHFRALGLVPFNVNPHYLETDPAMAPQARPATSGSASTTSCGPTPSWGSRKARGSASRTARRPSPDGDA